MRTGALQWIVSGLTVLLALVSARHVRDISGVVSCIHSDDGSIDLKISKSVFLSAHSVCINVRHNLTDEGDGYLHLRILQGSTTSENCLYQTEDRTSSYAVIMATRYDDWDAEFKCYLPTLNVRSKRNLALDESEQKPRLYVTDALGNILSYINQNSDSPIRMVLSVSGIPGAVGIKPTSCIAFGETNRYARTILKDGCGLGDVLSRTEGFVTDGFISRSPTFHPFVIDNEKILRFECNLTICKENCDGNKCEDNSLDDVLSLDNPEDSDLAFREDHAPYDVSTNIDVSRRTDMLPVNRTAGRTSIGIVQKVTNVQSARHNQDESLENDQSLLNSPLEDISQTEANDNNQEGHQTGSRSLNAQTALQKQRILSEQSANTGQVSRIIPRIINPNEDNPQEDDGIQNSPQQFEALITETPDGLASQTEAITDVPSDPVHTAYTNDNDLTEQDDVTTYPPDTFSEVKFLDFSDDIGILKLRQPAEGPELVDTYSEDQNQNTLPEDEDVQETADGTPQKQIHTDEGASIQESYSQSHRTDGQSLTQTSGSNTEQLQRETIEADSQGINTLDIGDLNTIADPNETSDSQLGQQTEGSDEAFVPLQSTQRSSPTDEEIHQSAMYRNYLPSEGHIISPDPNEELPQIDGTTVTPRLTDNKDVDAQIDTSDGIQNPLVNPNIYTETGGTHLLSGPVTKGLFDNNDDEMTVDHDPQYEPFDSYVPDPDTQEVMDSLQHSITNIEVEDASDSKESDSKNLDPFEVVSDSIYQVVEDQEAATEREDSGQIVEASVYAKVQDDATEEEDRGYRPNVGSDVINSMHNMKKESDSALVNAAVATDMLEVSLEHPDLAPINGTPIISLETDSFSTEDESKVEVKDNSIDKQPSSIPFQNITLNDSPQQPFETVLIADTKTNSTSNETYVLGSTPAKFAVGAVVLILFALSFLGILVAHCRRRSSQM